MVDSAIDRDIRTAAMPAPRATWRDWIAPAIAVPLLVAAVFGAFWPALGAGFVQWDDPDTVMNNVNIRGLGAENIRWMCTTFTMGHYHPLTWLSYAVDYRLWGSGPGGFHAVNVAIHAVNAVLVYALALRLIRLGRERGARENGTAAGPGLNSGKPGARTVATHLAAALGAAAFSIHPLRAESVAWVTERRDVLSAMFLLLATLAYLRSVEPAQVRLRSWAWTAATTAALTLSLLSKAWGMSFFVVALVLDWYPLARLGDGGRRGVGGSMISAARLIAQKAPFIAIGVIAAVVAGRAQYGVFATKSLSEWGVMDRAVQALYGLAFYVRASVLPIGLSPLYELPESVHPWEARYLVAYAIIAFGVAAMWFLRRRAPALVAAALIYAVMLGPVLGVLQSGEQFVADRYSYLACIGWSILVGVGVLKLASKFQGAGAALVMEGALAVVVMVLGPLTYSQAMIWRDNESLWSHAAEVTPTPGVRTNYAIELVKLNRVSDAMAQLDIAVKEGPHNGRAWMALSEVCRDRKQFNRAEQCLKQAVGFMPQSYMPKLNLGALYLHDLDRPEDALEMFKAAVADVESGGRRAISGLPYLALGDALLRARDRAGAKDAFTKALKFSDVRDAAQQQLTALGDER